jgi:hypothetical protein
MPTRFARQLVEPDTVEVSPGYLFSETHYLSVAGRILRALRGETSLIVVTGNPAVEPQPLSDALGKLAGPRQTVIRLACGPDLACSEELFGAGAILARRVAEGGRAVSSDAPDGSPRLIVFDNADRLSDKQIEEICAATVNAQHHSEGVLLADEEFLVRLDRPPLHPLKEAFATLRFDEIGGDEAIDFLRHQLAARQSQEDERRFRPVFFRGLAVCGVLAGVIIGASLVLRFAAPPEGETPDGETPGVHSVPPAAGQASRTIASLPSAGPSTADPSAASPASKSTAAPPPVPLQSERDAVPKPPAAAASGKTPDAEPPQDQPRPAPTASVRRLSAQENAALVARGDKFLGVGDIASARLFYERAADAGNGAAALRLGATFDPNVLGRAGVPGSDPAQAAAWYRRARDLGEAGAAAPLKALDR